MKFEWKIDDDGDHALYIDGDYFGLVCACQYSRFHQPVAMWGERWIGGTTIEECRAILEDVARIGEDKINEVFRDAIRRRNSLLRRILGWKKSR